MKKNRLFAGALCVMLAAMLIVPAAAHGCHGGRGHHSGYRQNVQTTVTVCPYEDCTQAGRHTHNGVIYCGYSHSSGVCDGNCRALCPYEDCTEAGRHTHDGVTYCGANHDCGYCDNTCAVRGGHGCGGHGCGGHGCGGHGCGGHGCGRWA